jgi:hypothetical protein
MAKTESPWNWMMVPSWAATTSLNRSKYSESIATTSSGDRPSLMVVKS